MTLEEALEYAHAHQPSLRAAEARARAATAQAEVPRAQWFPRLGVSAQLFAASENNTTSSYIGGGFVDVPRIGGTKTVDRTSASWTPYASSLVGLGLRQEVYDFGRIAAESAVADATAEAEQLRARAANLNLILGVKEAYFAVLAAQAIVSTAETAWGRAKQNRDFAAAGVHSGLRNPIDLTRAEAELMRLDVGRIRARGSLAAAQGVFAALIGSPERQLDAKGQSAEPPAPPPLAEGQRQSQTQDPELLAAEARLRAEQARTRAITREFLPDLSLSGAITARAGGAPPSSGTAAVISGVLPEVPNWDVGLVLTWRAFDEGILARRAAALQTEAVFSEELASARLNSSAAVEQTYAALEVARGAIPALERAVEAGQANYAQADARFRAGLGTSLELADAEALKTDSEIQLALGRFERDRARARLARAIAEAP